MSSEVIKEFLVSLGYKSDETALKKFTGGIQAATEAVFKLGAAIDGMALAVGIGVAKFADNLEQLYFASQRTHSSATFLKSYARTAQDFGASADEALGSVEALATFMRSYGGADLVGSLFHVQTRGANGRVLGAEQILPGIAKFMQGMPVEQATMFGAKVGLSQNTILAMMNPEFLKRFDTIDSRLRSAGFDKAADDSHQFMTALRDLGDQLVILGTQVGDALEKKLGWSLKAITQWFQDNSQWIIRKCVEIADFFIDSFQRMLLWCQVNWPRIKSIIEVALLDINFAWTIYLEPALGGMLDLFLKLDYATDGWATKLGLLAFAIKTLGIAGLITGPLKWLLGGLSLGGAAGGGLGGLLASIFGVSASGLLSALVPGAVIGGGLGWLFDEMFPNNPLAKFGESMGEGLQNLLQKANPRSTGFADRNGAEGKRSWVADMLESMGWPREQAEGLADNSMAESTMDPLAINKTNGYRGLFQWSPSRWKNFETFAQINKMDVNDPYSQVAFANYEMRFGGEQRAGGLLSATRSRADAAYVGAMEYERVGSYAEAERRAGMGNQVSQNVTIHVNGAQSPETVAQIIGKEIQLLTRNAILATV